MAGTTGRTRGALRPRLNRAISEGVELLKSMQSPDGLWRAPSLPGPLHVSLGLLPRFQLLDPSEPRLSEDRPFVERLLEQQAPEGWFPAYAGSGRSVQVTRIAELALSKYLERMGSFDPALRHRLTEAIRRARAAIAQAPGPREPLFLEIMADLLTDSVRPESRELITLPATAQAARAVLDTRLLEPVRHRISLFAKLGLPSMAVLFEKAAARSGFVRLLNQLGTHLGPLGPAPTLAALERQIVANQGEAGGWLWSVMGTGLTLLALAALGRDPGNAAVARGLSFIDGKRVLGPDGRPMQNCCSSETWDSCASATVLLSCGLRPGDVRARELVEVLLAEQEDDGLWSFGAGGAEGDVDSSTVVVTLLADLGAHLPEPLAGEVTRAVRRCVPQMLATQQADGGWGYSPPPHRAPYSFGRRVPTAMESGLVDASTADVTARISAAVATARPLLGPEERARVSSSLPRAARYLERTQARNGSWYGRWSAGYLSSAAFVSGGAAEAGFDLSAPWLSRTRKFVLAHQNPDGGWGEQVAADWRPELAGVGPSTPVQTGYGIIALAAAPPDPRAEAAMARAVEYLIDTQRDGGWSNGVALFTHAFQEDYYDSPLLTLALVLEALDRYRELGRA